MNEVEIKREILNEIIKKTIKRIKSLQVQLEEEKVDRKNFGVFEDCGDFYREQVIQTKAVISELVSQKISLEKWRKKLTYEKI